MRHLLIGCALLAMGSSVALAQTPPPAPDAPAMAAPAPDAAMAPKPMMHKKMAMHHKRKMHHRHMMMGKGGMNNDAISGPGGGHSHYQTK